MGRIVPEVEKDTVSEVFIYSYRLMYELQSENIYILALIHAKRDFDGKSYLDYRSFL